MFDIAWSELMLIGAVALVVIGPKDLPKAMRTVGQAVGKVRRMAAEFQGQFNDAMREAELHELKKQVEDVGGSVSSAMNTDGKSTDYKPIEMPRDDFGITDPPVSVSPDAAAMKEAEAKLAALPLPDPLPPVEIAPAPVAEPEAPKRKRAAKAPAEPAEAAIAEDIAEPVKPVRKRRAKASEDGSAA
jgi:sec-independent protein translocase protein TatB